MLAFNLAYLLLCFILATSRQSTHSTSYLSYTIGQIISPLCEAIPTTVTTDVLYTQNGSFEGGTDFEYIH